MREISTDIDIKAPRDVVWEILLDFPSYAAWNPFIPQISGTPAAGERLEVFIRPPGARGMTFRPRVLTLREAEEFRWLGRVMIPGIFDGEHIFRMEENGKDGTRFVQREQFRGLLVPFLWNSLDTNTRRGFREMNAALKLRAEQAAGAGELDLENLG